MGCVSHGFGGGEAGPGCSHGIISHGTAVVARLQSVNLDRNQHRSGVYKYKGDDTTTNECNSDSAGSGKGLSLGSGTFLALRLRFIIFIIEIAGLYLCHTNVIPSISEHR